MKVNNTEYGFTINPSYGKVVAEIYRVATPIIKIGKDNLHIHLIKKEFGKWYRKPIEKDYEDARLWINQQMKYIQKANELSS